MSTSAPASVDVDVLVEYLDTALIRLAVFGEFSAGKTMVLNALIGEELLSVAGRPREDECPFLFLGAMQLNVRYHKAVRSAMALIPQGISKDGYRQILSLNIPLREMGVGKN